MRRERKNQELEMKLLEYRQWARTYGGYHSRSTVPKQIRTIRRFGEICNMLNPKASQEDIIEALLKDSERGIQPQTLNHLEYDIEAWARFLGMPITLPRFKQSRSPEPWIPTDEDVMKIRKYAASQPNRGQASRDSCLIDLLFAGGMRIGELIQINLEDLDGNVLTIKSEKGEAPRQIGLPDSLVNRLSEYIEKYRIRSDSHALFTTLKGRLDYNWARNLIKKLAIKAGVPKFHAHAARHWCATTLLRRGPSGKRLDIREVQIHLGHSSLSSTQRYTHIKGREVAEHVKERMGEFFRMKNEMVDSIKRSSNPHGTELELDGTVEICPLTADFYHIGFALGVVLC